MPRSGTGEYSQPASTDAVPNATASSTAFNTLVDDIGDELENSLSRDGQGGMRQNLPMGGKKISNMAAGTVASDAIRVDQVQQNSVAWVVSGGTADAITATYGPAITTLINGMRLRFRSNGPNLTTTPTFKPGTAVTAKVIVKRYGVALEAGDIPSINYECEVVYQSGDDWWVLLNPAIVTSAVAAATTTVAGKVELATQAETINGLDTDRAVTPFGLAALTGTATRSGLLELATDAETLTGTDTARATTPANIKSLWIEYDMGAYALQATYTQAHSLSTYPKSVRCYLQCNNAAGDGIYAENDRIIADFVEAGADRGISLGFNATNVFGNTGANVIQYLANNGVGTNLTTTRWNVIFRVQK